MLQYQNFKLNNKWRLNPVKLVLTYKMSTKILLQGIIHPKMEIHTQAIQDVGKFFHSQNRFEEV